MCGMMDGMMGTCMNTKSMDVLVLLLRHHQQVLLWLAGNEWCYWYHGFRSPI